MSLRSSAKKPSKYEHKISLQYSLFSMKLGYLSPILEQRLNAEKKELMVFKIIVEEDLPWICSRC